MYGRICMVGGIWVCMVGGHVGMYGRGACGYIW